MTRVSRAYMDIRVSDNGEPLPRWRFPAQRMGSSNRSAGECPVRLQPQVGRIIPAPGVESAQGWGSQIILIAAGLRRARTARIATIQCSSGLQCFDFTNADLLHGFTSFLCEHMHNKGSPCLGKVICLLALSSASARILFGIWNNLISKDSLRIREFALVQN